MDDTFNGSKVRLLKPITSVVVITLIAVLFFSVPQTYAMGTNEDFLENLSQNYQQTSKLSDFVQKVLSIFSKESLNQDTTQRNVVNNTSNTTIQQNLCKNDEWSVFIDIQDSEYKEYIKILYNRWIVVWFSNKFLPNDELRFYCMIKMLVDSYRSKVGYDLKTQLWLSQKNYFSNVWSDIDKIFLKYLNTAYELGFLQWISDIDVSSKSYFKKNASKSTVKKIFDNIYKEFPLLVNESVINQLEIWNNSLPRWDYAKNLVNFFEFEWSQVKNTCTEDWRGSFSDIMNHDYLSDIQVLADLWIINSHPQNFYANNYLRYYELIILLTKTILYKEHQELNIYVLDHITNLEDIDPNASYAKYFEYAYHNWFLDYWFDPLTGKPKVDPNKFVKIEEINNVFSKLVGRKIQFETKWVDGIVTRWEFADMLVDGFWLEIEDANKDVELEYLDNTNSGESLLQEISWRLKSTKLLSKL